MRTPQAALASEKRFMNAIRGIILFGMGVFALYEGWRIHVGERAWLGYLLGVVAIGLGIWRLTRKETRPSR